LFHQLIHQGGLSSAEIGSHWECLPKGSTGLRPEQGKGMKMTTKGAHDHHDDDYDDDNAPNRDENEKNEDKNADVDEDHKPVPALEP
jgi:hypothetical protein